LKLIHETVVHPTFGTGKIVSIDESRVDIWFTEPTGQKAFVYPDAFGQHLHMSDPDAQSFVLAEYAKKKQEHLAVEKQRVEQLRREEADRAEKIAAKGLRKAATKKGSPSTKK
jgi:hypothetical protein